MGTLYASIKNDLLAKIKDGTYAEGDTIPSEVDLAKEYGVSRPTVRQALRILTNDGYLDRRKRRGTVVANPNRGEAAPAASQRVGDATSASRARGVQSFEDGLQAAGNQVRTMPILVKGEQATDEVAAGLAIEPGDLVYKLVRLRYVGDVPNVFMENYVPGALYPKFIDGVDFSKRRLYARMRELGRPVRSLRRTIDVIKADPSMSIMLDVPIGDPLFLIHTVGLDGEGAVVEYSVATYRGCSNTFEFAVADPEAGAAGAGDAGA